MIEKVRVHVKDATSLSAGRTINDTIGEGCNGPAFSED